MYHVYQGRHKNQFLTHCIPLSFGGGETVRIPLVSIPPKRPKRALAGLKSDLASLRLFYLWSVLASSRLLLLLH